MPRTIRFHLDENCPRAVASGLPRRGIEVTTTPDAGLLAASDEEQDAYALSQGRVLFTQDEHFLALHASKAWHPGLAYCKKGTRSIGEIIRGLVLIWEIYDPEEMENKVEYL
jgi:predicted nuclease of predicted toxin-antitoxin system